MLPAQFCFYQGSILSAIQYAKGRFAIPSLAPVVYNIFIILGGVLLLLSDSTNVERPGRSGSESSMKPILKDLLARTRGRFFLSSFSSHLHRIRQLAEQQVAKLRSQPDVPAVVVDAPLLIEAGWNGFCDKIVYVEAPHAMRSNRARARGWSSRCCAT